ncbi:hypothetical protein EDB89DRAFT_1927798 [Lactarius sanguifluus]|nr:hypothetical protein EDB89DRAFT_1927798 [Lactarius sanguifluus]
MTTETLTRTNGLIWHHVSDATHFSEARCKACMGSRDCRYSYSNTGRVMGHCLCRAKPDLAVQVARRVVDDVFSTSITFAVTTLTLRTPCISVSADLKMRQFTTQQDTLALMERIANKGINRLTIHYRTRNLSRTTTA